MDPAWGAGAPWIGRGGGPHAAVLVGRARQGGVDPHTAGSTTPRMNPAREHRRSMDQPEEKSREPPLRAEGRAGERKAWCGLLARRRRGRWEGGRHGVARWRGGIEGAGRSSVVSVE
jgi:hypothetical protein